MHEHILFLLLFHGLLKGHIICSEPKYQCGKDSDNKSPISLKKMILIQRTELLVSVNYEIFIFYIHSDEQLQDLG